jgi:hypothetical protein
VQHVAGSAASRLGYGRRVVPSRVVGPIVFALTATIAIGACGSNRHATGFCARVEQSNPVFNSLDASHQEAALALFDKVADTAPPAVAADLHTVSAFRRRLVDDPNSVDPSILKAYVASTKRVDAYLHDTCGIAIPPTGRLF